AGAAYLQGNPKGTYLGNLHGSGGLLVFNSWRKSRRGHVYDPKLWTIVGTHKTLLRTGFDAMAVASVDRDRILVRRHDGRLTLLDAEGKVLNTFAFPPKTVRGVALTGPRVVVLTQRTVDVYETR